MLNIDYDGTLDLQRYQDWKKKNERLLWQMKNEPNNSQLDKQDEASELAHVPAWEGQDDFADYNQNEANDYSNE